MHAQVNKSLQKLHHFTGSIQKDRPLFPGGGGSGGVCTEMDLAQRAGFVCRHRLIINRIAMVRGDIAFIA